MRPRKIGTFFCTDCGKQLPSGRRSACMPCFVKRFRAKRLRLIQEMRGVHCEQCGYGGVDKWPMLDFHHRDPADKLFNVNAHTVQKTWTRVVAELAKCDLLCCRCHRERHYML